MRELAQSVFPVTLEGKKKWRARIRWRDHSGQVHSKTKTARSRSHANTLLAGLLAKYGAPQQIAKPHATFDELATAYQSAVCVPAVYAGARKVSGYKFPQPEIKRVKQLKAYWGSWALDEINGAAIEAYKAHLYATKTIHGNQRQPADVNHALRKLRHMLNWAVKQRWLVRNPFAETSAIINAADEAQRDWPEQVGDYERLLSACDAANRHWLRCFIALMVHTGARTSEINRLTRGQIHFELSAIELTATTTKTQQARWVPISDELRVELEAWLPQMADQRPEALLFSGVKGQHLWERVTTAAKLPGLQKRDLRHWGTTRLLNAMNAAGLSHKHTQQITGHTVEKTFTRYIRTGLATAQAAAAALNSAPKSNPAVTPQTAPARPESPETPDSAR